MPFARRFGFNFSPKTLQHSFSVVSCFLFSITIVSPAVFKPAKSIDDLICAEATGLIGYGTADAAPTTVIGSLPCRRP